MKLKVTQPLEIRNQPSTQNGEVVGILQPGFIFDAVEKVNGLWLKDANGFYYERGKVEEVIKIIDLQFNNNQHYEIFESQVTFPPSPINYNQYVLDNIFKGQLNNQGEGIHVLVIDTGIETHPDLLHVSNKLDFSITNGNAMDYAGHGTHVAGIIAARDSTGKGITGVAPKCKLTIVKYKNHNTGIAKNILQLTNAITWAIENDVNIINISQNFLKTEWILNNKNSSFEKITKIAHDKGIVLCCAAGDVRGLILHEYYPAKCENAISIGSINTPFINSHPNPHLYNTTPDILTPYVPYWSTSSLKRKFYLTDKGSSMCTAFITGIIALILSDKLNKGINLSIFKKYDIISFLKHHHSPIQNLNYNDERFNYHII